MFKTRVTEMLGIKYPIIAGGMQWLSRAELAAAVSNAGGLGVITSATFDSKEEFRQELRKARGLTDKPIGVNVNLFPTARPIQTSDYIDILIEEGVRVVETSGRSPEPYMERLKGAGVKVIHKVPAVRFARTAERVGVDAVALIGFEGAGHPGMDDVPSLILIPLAADAVKIPVIAAGGFADARGFLAALTLGAEAVLMGTRMMATTECALHPQCKERLLAAAETDTTIVQRSIQNPARALRNKVTEQVLEMERRGTTLEELMPVISGLREKQAFETGDVDCGLFHCGESVGLVREVKPVKEVIADIVNGARALIDKLDAFK